MSKEENIILPMLALGGVLLLLSADNEPAVPVPVPGAPITPTEFIRKYWLEAKDSQRITTIPALVTLAQGGLESAWGNKAPRYNFFGIKASSGWTGEIQILPTHEYINGVWTTTTAKFRAYNSAREGFVDHGRFFIDNSRYKNALKYVSDPIEFTKQIAAAGYATDPDYAKKVIDVMKIVVQVLQRYNLI